MPRRRARSGRLAFLAPVLVAFFVMSNGDDRPTQAQAVPPYTVLEFGTLGGASAALLDTHEFAAFLVGQAQTSSGATHAALVRNGVLQDLGTLGGASSVAWGTGWNTIVGQAETTSLQTHAFRAQYRTTGVVTMTDIGTLGGTWSAAYGTDDQSIVGASTLAGSRRLHAFVYADGAMSPLPVDRGGDSVARDVRFEQAVGYACTAANASCRAFWVKDGVATTLPSLGGNAVANAINDWERIVGASVTANPAATHAFLFDAGTLIDLGTLGGANSEALDINTLGDVVGTSDVAAGGGTRAFLWRDGTMTDLNTVIPAGSGWVLQRATGISEGGQIVGVGTVNGQTRGFLLTPPLDLEVFSGGWHSQSSSNLPMGAEVGKTIRFIDSVVGSPDPLTIYGARLTATLTGPAEYVSVDSYDSTGAPECQLTATTITCNLLPIDTVGFGPEYRFTIRATGPGAITHTATATTGAPDANAANDTIVERNRAVALSALTLTPASVPGGKVTSVRLTLTGTAPESNDATVRLSSSRPDVAPVPATFVVPNHGGASREFNVIPAVVSQPTPVEITATYGLVTITKRLTVLPPALAQLYLTPTTIVGGCGRSAGKIVLTGAAPAGGAVVPLTNTNPKATVPATITVPAGASSQTFTVPTSLVTANQAGSVTASYGGVSQSLKVTVRPIRVRTLALSPNPVTGGSNASVSVVLECAAPSGGVTVNLSSSNAPVAAPTVASIAIPAGATTRSFTVRTTPVTANSSVNIYATVYGVRKTAALTVRP